MQDTGRIALTLGLLAASQLLFPATSRAAKTLPCNPYIDVPLGISTCYPPSEVGVAERRLRFHPIRPTPIVRRLLGLRLTQELVASGTPRGRPGPAHFIIYALGVVDPDCSARPTCPGCSVSTTDCAHVPPYVVVTEGPGHDPRVHGMMPHAAIPAPRIWQLSFNTSGRRLVVSITSDAPRHIVVRIAKEILKVAARKRRVATALLTARGLEGS